MFELVATSEDESQEVRLSLDPGDTGVIGRSSTAGLSVPWDSYISSRHAELRASDDELFVRRVVTARNAIHFRGHRVSRFHMQIGDEFFIGSTRFRLYQIGDAATNNADEFAIPRAALSTMQFEQKSDWFQYLSRLPQLIATSSTDEDFASSLVDLLIEAIADADAAAIIVYDVRKDDFDSAPSLSFLSIADENGRQRPPSMFRWKARRENLAQFRPSSKLISRAMQRNECLFHCWSDADMRSANYTVSDDLDWAFCVPLSDDSCLGWCLYVSGQSDVLPVQVNSLREALTEQMRFAGFLGQFVGAIRQLRKLERVQSRMSNFFPPAVLRTLSDEALESRLQPAETEITVMFCDLRGFSLRAERARHNLERLFHRVSDALGVMTRSIAEYGGVISDFQGDAALAFWGWPAPLSDGPLAACRAALAIRSQFPDPDAYDDASWSTETFHVGIGIGHGRAIAGQMGTQEQAKVGVFGPVVNVTSRLEGIAKHFRVPIAIDESTAAFVRQHLPGSEARVRRLGTVQPKGMEEPVSVFELLPPHGECCPVTDDEIEWHEDGVAMFESGRWSEALDMFDRLRPRDRAKDLLMFYMGEHEHEPPHDWDGMIRLDSK